MNSDMNWYPTPYVLCRRQYFRRFLRRLPPGRFLEIGFGSGEATLELVRAGWQGVGVEMNQAAIRDLHERLRALGAANRVALTSEVPPVGAAGNLGEPLQKWPHTFDLILAFEVLEHQPDDRGFLKQLRERLRPGGYLVLSVPAHARLWGPNDVYAGHVRRYERDQVTKLLTELNLSIIKLWSIGVPIANLTKPIFNWLVARQMRHVPLGNQLTQTAASAALGTGSWITPIARVLINDLTLWPAYFLQHLLRRTDWGVGYFIVARRP